MVFEGCGVLFVIVGDKNVQEIKLEGTSTNIIVLFLN